MSLKLACEKIPGNDASGFAIYQYLTNVEDDDLLTIRGSGAFARTLYPMDDGQRQAAAGERDGKHGSQSIHPSTGYCDGGDQRD